MSTEKKIGFGGLFALIVVLILFFINLSNNKKEEFLITFNTDGGNEIMSQTIIQDGKIIRPADPVKEGYVFDNWYVGDQVFDFNSGIINNIIIEARWKTDENYAEVTFDTDGGSMIENVLVKKESTLSVPISPSKNGYDFVEWQFNNKKYDFETKITSNITLKAVWKENVDSKENDTSNLKKYTVYFNSNGGSAIWNASVTEGNTVSKPANPTKAGYNFVEWQLNNKTYNFGTKVTSNITLKAVWKEKAKVTITFNSDGGSTVSSKTIYAGDKLGNITNPTKSGYTFDGWYLNNTKYTSNSTISSSVTLVAHWLDNDQVALNNAKNNVKPFNITKGGQSLTYTSAGCTSVVTPAESIAKVTRGLTDRTINVNVALTCGKYNATVGTTAVIQKSSYRYTMEDAGNQTNYYVRISGLSDYVLYKTGTSSIIGMYSATYSGATVTIQNISSHPNIDMVLNSDQNTIYVVTG